MRFKLEPGLVQTILRSFSSGVTPEDNPFVPSEDGVRLVYDTIVFDTRRGLVLFKKGARVVGSVDLEGRADEVTLTGIEGTMKTSFD